jgi:ketosteroid isomerase-like protein
MSEVDAVTRANAAFYDAFESLELARMEAVWLRAPYIRCVHPGWGLLVGWGPVMQSWQRIFQNTVAMRFRLTDVRAEVVGNFAWVTLTENLDSEQREGRASAQVLATNLFERRNDQWFLVHHHASPTLSQAPSSQERLH